MNKIRIAVVCHFVLIDVQSKKLTQTNTYFLQLSFWMCQ